MPKRNSESVSQQIFQAFLVMLGCMLPTFLACGVERDDSPKCYPVKGKILYNGEPMMSAVLTFQPLPSEEAKWDQRKPRAIVKSDGTFELSSYKLNDGAPIGEYAMTIRWSADAEGLGPDLLKGKYRDSKSPATKFTVSDSENQLETIEIVGPSVKRTSHQASSSL